MNAIKPAVSIEMSFLEALTKLPDPIQKKAREMIAKFLQDPTPVLPALRALQGRLRQLPRRSRPLPQTHPMRRSPALDRQRGRGPSRAASQPPAQTAQNHRGAPGCTQRRRTNKPPATQKPANPEELNLLATSSNSRSFSEVCLRHRPDCLPELRRRGKITVQQTAQ